MSKHWKILIYLLFALAVGLGLIQHRQDVKNLFGSHTTISHFNNPSADSLEGYYQKSQEIAGQQNQTQTATFLAVGDIMLSRNVALAILKNVEIKGGSGFDLPFEKMSDSLKSTDFNFGNLESPIVPLHNGIIGGHSMVFAAPSLHASGLKDYNFKILNLANNHAMDQGLGGIASTHAYLDNAGIQYEGTGENLDQAWTPPVVTANGIKICFVGASYASANDGGKATNNYVARMEDTARLKSAIDKARTECDFVVATMHGGTEYTRTPNKTQEDFAHAAIDDGADMVIGAHPHWIQTIEKYCPSIPPLPLGEGATSTAILGEGSQNCPNPKYIFYSLGNFIFDQNFSQDTKEGLTLKITISKSAISNPQAPNAAGLSDLQGNRTGAKLESVELLPVIIDNSQPRPATAEEAKKILQKIGESETILK